jgi:hypothetical protein
VNVLIKAADTQDPYERIKATQACLLLAEKLLGSNYKAEAVRIYTYLRDSRTDTSENYVRDAAATALAAAEK